MRRAVQMGKQLKEVSASLQRPFSIAARSRLFSCEQTVRVRTHRIQYFKLLNLIYTHILLKVPRFMTLRGIRKLCSAAKQPLQILTMVILNSEKLTPFPFNIAFLQQSFIFLIISFYADWQSNNIYIDAILIIN